MPPLANAPLETTRFLSDLLKRRVVAAPQGRILGRLRDLVADARQALPPITGLVVAGPRQPRQLLPWSHVLEIRDKAILVDQASEADLGRVAVGPGDLLLREQLLDKQIVDTAGAKVVRVNDLQLWQRKGQLLLGGVDVGLRGLMRRVGLQAAAEALLRWIFSYDLSDNVVKWHRVQAVGSEHILRLKLSQARLASLHPADLADILEDLDSSTRSRVFHALGKDMAADILEETDPKVQVALIRDLPTAEASEILEQMSPDEAADVLQGLDTRRAEKLLKQMEYEQASSVRCLLDHDEETAGGLMTTAFLYLPPRETAGRALEILRQQAPDLDVFYYIYVEDEAGKLLGVVNLRDLLTADPALTLDALMFTRLVAVDLEADPEDVAELFAKYGFRALPVLDQQGRVHGVIRFKALLGAVAPHLGR
ncbi:MAG: magnesium transporter [Desulfarculus sp.]|jgi:CBS domain-containing protein/sporulation protein YlmC with PRC-barrel domain|nr:MAG: magnesium transporter [Desulfarculus sp.]